MFSYTAEGLMTSMTDARGHVYQFTYDDLGRLLRDDDPAGGYKTVVRTDEDGSAYSVEVTTGLGRTTTYAVEPLSTGAKRQTTTSPAGLQTVIDIDSGGQRRWMMGT